MNRLKPYKGKDKEFSAKYNPLITEFNTGITSRKISTSAINDTVAALQGLRRHLGEFQGKDATENKAEMVQIADGDVRAHFRQLGVDKIETLQDNLKYKIDDYVAKRGKGQWDSSKESGEIKQLVIEGHEVLNGFNALFRDEQYGDWGLFQMDKPGQLTGANKYLHTLKPVKRERSAQKSADTPSSPEEKRMLITDVEPPPHATQPLLQIQAPQLQAQAPQIDYQKLFREVEQQIHTQGGDFKNLVARQLQGKIDDDEMKRVLAHVDTLGILPTGGKQCSQCTKAIGVGQFCQFCGSQQDAPMAVDDEGTKYEQHTSLPSVYDINFNFYVNEKNPYFIESPLGANFIY